MESVSRLHKQYEGVEKADKREGLALYEDAFNRTHNLLKEIEACNEGLDSLMPQPRH